MRASGNHSMDTLNHLTTSLMEEIKQVTTFRGRWSAINTKLASLPPLLTDLSDSTNTHSNPLSTDLIHSISQTLTHALSLAATCTGPNPVSGKLRTQSDIDAVSAKLGQLINDCDLLVKSGVLEDSIVSGSTKRECVRVQARNLITRLQIGDFESKRSAMDSLISLIEEDDKNVVIAVAQGAVAVIVGLMESSCVDLREKAVSAISRVSAVDSSRVVLMAEGVLLLNHLVRVLECGSGFGKEKACVALQSLSLSKENARGIGCRGGVSSLLEICQVGTPSSQAAAALVLRNLAGFDEIKVNFVEEGAVSVLIGLAGSGTAIAQENSIGCLSNLVSGDENLKVLVVREGGIECLKNYWDSAPMAKSLEVAVALLWNLVSCRPIAEVVASEGFIPRLVGALSCGILGVRITASRAACDLGFNSKMRKVIGECGCIALLVRMLEAKSVEEKECAAKALASLMQFAGNRRIYRKEERGIVGTVQLLDPSIHNFNKKYPISILLSVVQSKKCRKRMIDAGVCAFLPKLVEMEVEGAKKLLDGFERLKVWGLFPISQMKRS